MRARGLAKSYRGTRAVSGVDLVMAPGERVALLGPNGAGKTTTLMMLLGVVAPDAGTVELVGHLPLPDRLRVREALGVFARLYGVEDPASAARSGLERFGIAHLADAMGTELSSGQRTMVGIVKAVIHRPRLLVLDEPTASLDPDVAARARAGLEAVWAEHGTALLVTSHNMTDVERICERVVFLASGRVVADGPPRQVAAQFGQDDLEQVFIHLASWRGA